MHVCNKLCVVLNESDFILQHLLKNACFNLSFPKFCFTPSVIPLDHHVTALVLKSHLSLLPADAVLKL